MKMFEGLNPEQRAAVEHDEGPMLVVAGAGTGKTRVITHRIAHLVTTGKAKPGQILGLTFTEKAAREMEQRLHDLIGWESFQVPLMTFHAFGTELLGRYASHIGRSIRGGLLNDMQKVLLLQQHLDRMTFCYYGGQQNWFEFLEGVVAYIGHLQNAAVTLEHYDAYVKGIEANPEEIHPRDLDEQRDLLQLYTLYERVKAETGTFDYNDQLQLPLRILQERPNLAERLGQEYRYVLVDEYQDTNAVQDALLRTFVGSSGNIFAVGDDDQAIYGFRGADIGNILAFADRYKLAQPVVLSHNYRSGQAILDSAYRLIRHNDPERLEAKLGINKRLVAAHDKSRVEYVPYYAPADELRGVLAGIEARLAAGERADSMAVLASTHAPLKVLAKAMRARGVPFALSTAANIFEQPELLGLWHLLKWLDHGADEPAIGHVIMGPLIGWPAERYRAVLEQSKTELVGVEDVLRRDTAEDSRGLVRQIDEWRGWARELSVSQLAFKLVFETGRAEEWRERAREQARMIRVFEDLQRWLDQMQDFETVAVDTTLLAYLRLFPQPPALEVTEPVGDSAGVQLLTVHASKGLEFETVYLINCTQRSWSAARGGGGRAVPDELRPTGQLPPEHELRRLMYVAATRARMQLVVSAATHTSGGAKQAVSPFVGELLGVEVLERQPNGVALDRLGNVSLKLQQFHPMKQAEDARLPFETTDGWLELGVTALGAYEYCPFEFYLETVLGIRHPLGPQLAFGNVLHRVLEAYYKAQLTGNERRLEELHAMLDELWTDRGYEQRRFAEADRTLAHQTVEAYVARDKSSERQILGSEVAVRFEVPEAKLRLRGKIDALFEADGGVELRDFKTGRTKTNNEKLSKDAKDNFQLRSYALAYELLNGRMPVEVTLDYIVTGAVGSAKLSATILANHRAKLGQLADRIRAREFAPNPSPMHRCAAIRYYGTGERDAIAEELLVGMGEAE